MYIYQFKYIRHASIPDIYSIVLILMGKLLTSLMFLPFQSSLESTWSTKNHAWSSSHSPAGIPDTATQETWARRTHVLGHNSSTPDKFKNKSNQLFMILFKIGKSTSCIDQ